MLCKRPIFVVSAGGLVQCRQCLPCRINRRRDWTMRLLLEKNTSPRSLWVTLTYAPAHLPTSYTDANGVVYSHSSGVLNPSHLKDFFKRLRKYLPPRSLRYFACGEYGDKSWRPHYHICLFGVGVEATDFVRKAWSLPYSGGRSPLGLVHIGTLTQQSAQYTCGYALKKMTSSKDDRLEGRFPEFTRQSQGIGKFAVPVIVKSFSKLKNFKNLLTSCEIPRTINLGGKTYGLGRYIYSKILHSLGVYDVVKSFNLSVFKAKMSALRACGERTFPFVAPSVAFATETGYSRTFSLSINKQSARQLIFGVSRRVLI
ncbi:MAG: replication initiator protein [Microvirus sp.]|nr:MAG: replication initiator protein [Microvirus sp.]